MTTVEEAYINYRRALAAYHARSYEDRVARLEAEGLTRSDAQGVVDAEDLQAEAIEDQRVPS